MFRISAKRKQLLRNSGFRMQGFAAPFGTWNDELGRAIVDCGFEYSSEFSYDYDNLPSLPQTSERRRCITSADPSDLYRQFETARL